MAFNIFGFVVYSGKEHKALMLERNKMLHRIEALNVDLSIADKDVRVAEKNAEEYRAKWRSSEALVGKKEAERKQLFEAKVKLARTVEHLEEELKRLKANG